MDDKLQAHVNDIRRERIKFRSNFNVNTVPLDGGEGEVHAVAEFILARRLHEEGFAVGSQVLLKHGGNPDLLAMKPGEDEVHEILSSETELKEHKPELYAPFPITSHDAPYIIADFISRVLENKKIEQRLKEIESSKKAINTRSET